MLVRARASDPAGQGTRRSRGASLGGCGVCVALSPPPSADGLLPLPGSRRCSHFSFPPDDPFTAERPGKKSGSGVWSGPFHVMEDLEVVSETKLCTGSAFCLYMPRIPSLAKCSSCTRRLIRVISLKLWDGAV